jgi:5'-nucleotidase
MTAPLGTPSLPPVARRVFANRTLNLRAIEAVGFDMDYTLIHYHADEWEHRAFEYAKMGIAKSGWPVESLEFTPQAFTLGLVVDRLLGNVVKANRFGFVKRATHGSRALDFEEQRAVYSRVLVDLAEPRWQFMNTLFSLSEACLFAGLVDLIDAGKLPQGTTYEDAYDAVRSSLDAAHVEGALKREIVKNPERFVHLDEELPLALQDLRSAGKKLLVITNSEWEYTRDMMSYTFDRFVPGGWRSLFDLVIVGARKPEFFTGRSPIFEVVDDSGLLRPNVGPLREGGVYLGGNARLVEKTLECPGERILYVGDHIFSDVNVTKNLLRWRTALIIRALEDEVVSLQAFKEQQRELDLLMAEKELLEHAHGQLRLQLLRQEQGYGPKSEQSASELRRGMQGLRGNMEALDLRIAPLAKQASEIMNPGWGPMMHAGNDKSHLARQIERHADIYTSRVANLLYSTPFAYLRSPRGTLPHDVG